MRSARGYEINDMVGYVAHGCQLFEFGFTSSSLHTLLGQNPTILVTK